MNTEKGKKRDSGLYLLPLLMAAPVLAAAALAAVRFGPKILKLLNILIKVVVRA